MLGEIFRRPDDLMIKFFFFFKWVFSLVFESLFFEEILGGCFPVSTQPGSDFL